MMKFALLGTDPESIALVEATVAAGHTLVWCGDVLPEHATGFDLPQGDLGEQWESLLDDSLADAVIVGRGSDDAKLRTEQVGQLAKNGISLLTSFPLIDSVLAYYEIDMAREEGGAVLQHFNPLTQQHEIISQCSNWISAGHPQLGSIEQVVWERPLADRTKEKVLWHFSRDVELLALVAGRLNRLGALGSPDEAATYAGLSVQLLGKSEVPVRWQVGPIDETDNCRLIFIAQHGKLTVEFTPDGQATQLTTSQAGDTHSTPLPPVDAARQAIKHFAEATTQRNSLASTWPRALQAMELTDTIEFSLRRGRMIEVHQQQLTEQLAFKGTMSALGCGVLMVVPPLMLLLGWLAELLGFPIAQSRAWAYILLAFLGLFLALQLIPKLLFKPATPNQSAGQQQPDDSV